MSHKKSIGLLALSGLVWASIFTVSLTTPAQAQPQPVPTSGAENNCIKCHEDLYFLHDTGKWFCIRESPMTCTDCHDGDPSAITKELAHANRAAHPVINNDVSKCQECHPEKCDERVGIFAQSAGIHTVLVAVPYTPVFTTENTDVFPVEPQQEPSAWINAWEVLSMVLVAGAALAVYIVHRIRHRTKGKI
jgi:hypothetical protein